MQKRAMAAFLFAAVWLDGHPLSAAEFPLPIAKPETLGLSGEHLARIDQVVQQAIAKGELPGAVVVIVHRGHVVWRKAYGKRSLQPENTLMGPEVVFDLASLTKPIVTATAIMLLVEQGKLRLADLVALHVPGQPFHKAKITVEHLLLHTSGLIADNSLADYKDGRAKALERIYQLKPLAEPGSRFIYSDVGYIVLGDLVERLVGQPLDQFAQEHIFKPLGMNETGYRPAGKIRDRCAPTQMRQGRWLLGEVHDPRAHLLDGVAGHAGLFASADDLAVFAQMLLNKGTYRGRRLLSPLTVRLLTAPRNVPRGLRTFGWDMATGYSANRGELFPRGESFGHTGFTGTSLWLDPTSQTAVIFLSNRVHPGGKGNVTRLRGRVSTMAAAAVQQAQGNCGLRIADCGLETQALSANPKPQLPQVLTGIDVLVREKFARLKGKRIGLVTNQSGGRPSPVPTRLAGERSGLAARQLAGPCQRSHDGSRISTATPLPSARHTLRRTRMGQRDGEATGP